MMLDTGKRPEEIIRDKGLAQVSDDDTLIKVIDEIISANADVISQIKEGKESAMGFLIGQAMRKTQGKANPKKVGELMKRRILHE